MIKKKTFYKKKIKKFVRRNYYKLAIVSGLLAIILVYVFISQDFNKEQANNSATSNNASLYEKNSKELYEGGLAFFNKGNFIEAKKNFQAAVSKAKSNKSYLQYLGVTEYNLKEYDLAISHLEEALRLDADNYFVINILGNIYRDMDNIDKAKEYYYKSIEINPQFIVSYMNIVIILEEQGEIDKALDILNQGLKNNGSSIELLQIKESLKNNRQKNKQ